ncbi:MAG: ETC complex I subunit [Alphaproteobacteria bacterium]|nr:ETC complex I subunit [Alphaproteobacteria bacterium]
MTRVKIYQPAKTAMSSGKGNTKNWVLESDNGNSQYIEPIMQWTATTSTIKQIKLFFPTKEQAIQFAENKSWSYHVMEPKTKKIIPKSYTDNFARPK